MCQIFGDIFRKSSKVSRGTLYFRCFCHIVSRETICVFRTVKAAKQNGDRKGRRSALDVGCEREGYGYLKCGTAGVVPFGAFYKIVRRLRRLRAEKFLSARFSEYAPCIQRTPPSRSWLRQRRYLPCVSPLPRD